MLLAGNGGHRNIRAGLPESATSRIPQAASEAGHGDRNNCGVDRDHVGGRSRFSPALLNGVCFVGDELWSRWLAGLEPSLTCTGPISAVLCDAPAWCAAAAATSSDRNTQQPMAARKRDSAATMTMVDCHRGDLAATGKLTVPQLYQRRRLASQRGTT